MTQNSPKQDKKKQQKKKLGQNEILTLVASAQRGDAAAVSKLNVLLADKKTKRRILNVLEGERTKHLSGYKGRDHSNPLNFNMYPYRN